MKDDLRQGADRVTAILREAGYQAYFAGGCVRDQLLGLAPKDYDIVTDARPGQVVALFKRTIEVGAAFGVVKVLMARGRDYEVATFRTDGSYSDGRRPDEVVYSDDWREDVARRDLTINALLMDPVTEEVLDAVGGRSDLEAGLIRAVGAPARRFEEDKLRMLRAVRFAARFDFSIEPETRDAIRRYASELSAVSKERIVAELEGIVRGRPELGFRELHMLGLLGPALPHVPPSAHSTLIVRMGRLSAAADGLTLAQRYVVAWAVSLDGLDSKPAEAALRALKLSREAIRGALRLRDAWSVLRGCDDPARASVMRLAAADDADVVAAFQAVMLGPSVPVDRFCRARQDLAERPLPPRPVVTGADLKAMGLPPGRAFKDILNAVDDAVLERRVSTRDEGLAMVDQLRADTQ